jgi:hypothetical protein
MGSCQGTQKFKFFQETETSQGSDFPLSKMRATPWKNPLPSLTLRISLDAREASFFQTPLISHSKEQPGCHPSDANAYP